jgi:addiction module HigA family antidote
MPKTAKTPAFVLQSFIDEYQINPFSLSKSIHLNYQTILRILKGNGKITVSTALRLGKFFNLSPAYWIDIQFASEINELAKNKKFISMIKSIPKARKPAEQTKTTSKTKPAKRKNKTLSEKRRKAAKIPGAKSARGRRRGRPRKK